MFVKNAKRVMKSKNIVIFHKYKNVKMETNDSIRSTE